MVYEVAWSESALADLEAISAYIAARSPVVAQRIDAAILARAESLSTFPHIGQVYSQGGRGPNREIAYKKYRILYRVHEVSRRVEILAVWHGARSGPDLSD